MFDTVDELARRGPHRRRRRPRRGRAQRRQGARQGPAQDDLQDGDLDDPVLLRRADLRGRRASRRRSSTATSPAPRRASAASASTCSPRRRSTATRARTRARIEDLLPVGGVYAWRRDGEHHMWNPETIALLQHAVRGRQRRRAGEVRRVRRAGQRRRRAPGDAARAADASATDREPIPLDEVEPAKEIVKRFATGAMSLGLDLHRGPRDAGDRDEPPRRPLEHGRGRGGPAPLHARRQRRPAPLGDQAGRLGPLRRDDPLPRQRRPAADQDGPGRQARRGRPAARPQGRQVHRLGAPHDAGRRPDLAAAAPRHLLDRGPQAAHLRPALREPERARCR